MRVLACSLLLSICLFAQSQEAPRLFPIPKMDKVWPDAVLSDSEKNLLKEAVEPDLRDLEKYCEQKSTFESLDKTSIALGTLGKGVLVSTRGSCSCGGTGNCTIYVYARESDRYRRVLSELSSAFAAVNSKADIPDIVLSTHSSARRVYLTKYRYVGDRFSAQACETLTAKDPDSGPKSWWDPNEVLVQPCKTH